MAAPPMHADVVSSSSKRPATSTLLSSKRARFGSDDTVPLAPGEIRPAMGEVRFDGPDAAEQALQMSGGVFQGKGGNSTITIDLDERSKDGTKIYIHNLPHETEWQEVKDFFAQCGRIAFAGVIGGKGSAPAIAEVRYEFPEHAQLAISLFNGRVVEGYEIEVKTHFGSKDGTKLQVFGLPPDTEWQELKDWFAQAGIVIFVDIVTKNRLPPGAVRVGEVRYESASHAQQAVAKLNGSLLGGREISVDFDMDSVDGSKLEVRNIPIGIEWQELKDHFQATGTVAFTQVRTIGQNGEVLQVGKGKGKSKGAQMPSSPMMHNAGCMDRSYQAHGSGCMDRSYQAHGGPGKGHSMSGYTNGGCNVPMGGYIVPTVGSMGKGISQSGSFGGGYPGDAGGYYGGNVGYDGYAGCMGGGHTAVGEAGGTKRGEVRYDQAVMAQSALDMMNGTVLSGSLIEVRKDMLCHDGSRVLISGLSPSTSWQELKDHFSVCGHVAFADIKGQKGGKGKHFPRMP